MNNYQVLTEVYRRLARNPNDKLEGMQLFHSSVGFAVASVKAQFGIEYSYRHMANLMVEEELLGRNNLPVTLNELVTNVTQVEKESGFDTTTNKYL